jgi:predicted dienelactone hydrolase
MKTLPHLMTIAVLTATILSLPCARLAAGADHVGLRSLAVPIAARGTTLTATIWYPALPGGETDMIGDSKIFVGVPAGPDAPPAPGPYPLVLLSQGGLRSAPNLGAWLAAHLAARGFIVVTTSPPRLTPDKVPAAAAEIWLRPADLSATLDVVTHDQALVRHLAADRVAAIGLQLGGTAALALAGGRLEADSYRRSCDPGASGLDCTWFAKNGIDLHKLDAGKIGATHLDPRVKAIVLVDPEQSGLFTPASLAAIKLPVAVINLGAAGAISPALDASRLPQQIAGASYTALADATRFSAFSLCTARGAILLKEEGDDDSICADGATLPRDDIHRRLAALIEDFLGRNLR